MRDQASESLDAKIIREQRELVRHYYKVDTALTRRLKESRLDAQIIREQRQLVRLYSK